jgi:hypothetical protein
MTEEDFLAEQLLTLLGEDELDNEEQKRWAEIRKNENLEPRGLLTAAISDLRKIMRQRFVEFSYENGIDLSAPDWFQRAVYRAAMEHKAFNANYRGRGRRKGKAFHIGEGRTVRLSEDHLDLCARVHDAREFYSSYGIDVTDTTLAKAFVYIEDKRRQKVPPMKKHEGRVEFEADKDVDRQKNYQRKISKCNKVFPKK